MTRTAHLPHLIAVTGGIGSGKSVVCNILTAMGYPVYDCDSNARRIIDSDPVIIRRIADEVCPEAVRNGKIDRRRLAECVFADREALRRLNAITHSAVIADIEAWRVGKSSPAFVETAILCESGLDRIVDEVWDVEAPRDLRIARVMSRNGISRREVEARMDNQTCARPTDIPVITIVNDGMTPLVSRIAELIDGRETDLQPSLH